MPAFSKEKSRIKLVIYVPTDSGDISRVFYNYITKNSQNDKAIIGSMKRRILEGKFLNHYRLAIFYDNNKNIEIERIKGNLESMTYNSKTSTIKMIVYLKDIINLKSDTCYVRYSPLAIADEYECIQIMKRIYLEILYQNKFRTAIFYRNSDNSEITKIYGTQFQNQ